MISLRFQPGGSTSIIVGLLGPLVTAAMFEMLTSWCGWAAAADAFSPLAVSSGGEGCCTAVEASGACAAGCLPSSWLGKRWWKDTVNNAISKARTTPPPITAYNLIRGAPAAAGGITHRALGATISSPSGFGVERSAGAVAVTSALG